MKEYNGYRLYVNLGPSKVRRRLRHRGFGVKSIQSAGTNRALIIHTATGSHREELERLFADVLPVVETPVPEPFPVLPQVRPI